ncbi:hypothetical protein DV737_g2389, partial [Chaetothyriales sp. CBS 132003]
MGCGPSSLKGDSPQGINNDDAVDNRPIRKVATNFTTVDYEQEHYQERRNTAYAPHETERTASATSDAIRHAKNGIIAKDEGPKDSEQLKASQSVDAGSGEQVKAYQSIDAGNVVSGDSVAVASSNVDPTAAAAKENFASANDPAANQQQEQPLATEEGNTSSSPSWQNNKIKEDDLIKYTGKSKDDVLDMVDRGDGVGRGQPADSRYTPTHALATGVA